MHGQDTFWPCLLMSTGANLSDRSTMTKEELIAAVKDAGEAIINYRSAESNKLKYNTCTLDFDNPHIQTKQNRAKETEDTVLLYCWDVDSYRLLKPANVTSVVPLADALKGGRNGRR